MHLVQSLVTEASFTGDLSSRPVLPGELHTHRVFPFVCLKDGHRSHWNKEGIGPHPYNCVIAIHS